MTEFDALFVARYPAMVRLATLLVGPGAIAEELVQDVFARVHARLAGIDNPDAHLRTAVVNACRNEHRRRAAARRVQARAGAPREAVEDHHDELLDVLARLPARQRAALVLRFYEQASEAEIAAALGCRPGTVKSLVHRGLARVREELGDDGV